MNLFSHLVITKQIEPVLAPDNRDEFYWGAVAPDMRYLAGLPRNQTHLSREQMASLSLQYPGLRSFLLGYFVHCLLDELDLTRIICSKLPLSLLRRQFSPRKTAALVELYVQEKVKVDQKIQGTYNALLCDLGIDPIYIETFATALNQYFSCPSIQSMISISQDFGLFEDERIQKYIKGAEQISRNPLVKRLLFFGVKNAQVDKIAISHVRASLLEIGVSP